MDLHHLLSNCCFQILCIFLQLKGKPCSQTTSKQGCPGGCGARPPLAAPPRPSAPPVGSMKRPTWCLLQSLPGWWVLESKVPEMETGLRKASS